MAFPWVFRSGFETGSSADFTAETDTTTIMDFPHYTELARYGMVPYRGAYCARIRLAGGTTTAHVREDTAFDDLDVGVTRWVRWYFYLGRNFVMTDADKFSMIEFESTLNTTTEVAAGILRDGDNINFWYNETQAAASASTITLGTTTTALNKWYSAELGITLAAGTGTIDGYINDLAGTQIASLTQADIVDVKFGVIGPDAGTSGTLLLDDLIYDDAQVYRDRTRYRSQNCHVTFAYDHPIIGPGRFSIAMTGTGGADIVSLYDTDGGIPNRLEAVAVLRNVSANETIPGHDIFEVKHGLLTIASGTATQSFISIAGGGLWSDGAIINRGLQNGFPRPR